MESKNEDKRRDEGKTSYEQTPHSSSYPQTYPRVTGEEENDEGSIFDLFLGTPEQKAEVAADLKKDMAQGFEYAKDSFPGFFTPFRSKKEFGIVAAAPLALPLASALITGAAVIAAAGATLTALGSLVFAAGFSLDGLRKGHEESKTKAHDALILAAKAGIAAAVCAAVAVAAALFTAVIAPIALTYLLTRSAATVVAKANECISSCGSEENDSYRNMSYS